MGIEPPGPRQGGKFNTQGKREEQTQTQKIQEIAFFDVQKDDNANPLSAMNIDTNARHQSDEDTPDEDDNTSFHLQHPSHIVISCDPDSPDPEPDQQEIRRSPSQPFRLGPIRQSRLAIRRRITGIRHSTPTRQRLRHQGVLYDSPSDSDNNPNRTIDSLIFQL